MMPSIVQPRSNSKKGRKIAADNKTKDDNRSLFAAINGGQVRRAKRNKPSLANITMGEPE